MRAIYFSMTQNGATIKITARVFLALTLWIFSQNTQSAALEYQVKASYLYNFLQFIAWPDDVFGGEDKFNMCVLGADRFGAALDGVAGERIEGREIVVYRLEHAAQAQTLRCHMLFIAAGAGDTAPHMTGGRGLLVIGETPGFLARGGIINLVDVRGRIRFEINQQTANKAGLVVSSRLLSLAVNKP